MWLECTDKDGNEVYIPVNAVKKIHRNENSFSVYYKHSDVSSMDEFVSIFFKIRDVISNNLNFHSVEKYKEEFIRGMI